MYTALFILCPPMNDSKVDYIPPQNHFSRLFDVFAVEFSEKSDISGTKNSANYDIGMTRMSYVV